MLEGISQIKDKVHASRYEDEGRKTYNVDNIVAELKNDEKFKNFSEGELYEYAYGLIATHNAYTIKSSLESMGFDTGKPKDPFWSQYTYEEILNMVNDGVEVPQEFIDWANTMQDSDTTAYQIEDSSEDPNAYENLLTESGDVDESDIQKRAQALSSKAQSQEQLIYNRVEEAKPLVNTVQAEKNDIEQNQRLSLQKFESMQTEWKTLDRKFKQGKVLTDNEQKRYKQLGIMLNDQNNSLMQQVQKANTDIEELTSQIENIDMLLNVNEKITAEIENVGTKMSWFEGGKNHIILQTNSGNQILGISASFYAAAMGNNLAIDTGLSGINLFFNNLEVENLQGNNMSVVDQTQETVDVVNDTSKNEDSNLKYTTNKQAETQGDNTQTQNNTNNNAEATQNPQITNNADTNTKPDKTTNTVPLIENTELPDNNQNNAPMDSESGNINNLPEVIEESEPLAIKSDVQLQSKAAENVSQTPTVNIMTGTANATSANAAQTEETSETADTSSTTGVTTGADTTDTSSVSETSVETEDPLEAETSQYVSECTNRNNAMAQAEQQIQSQVEEIIKIRANQKQEDAKLNAELSKNIAEYEKLAQKVQNGEALSESDQKRVKALEKALNSNNGTFIVEMQDKATTLTGFASQLRNDIQTTKDNQEYGKEAVQKGKEYAKATLGDRTYLQNIYWFAAMSKEKQYDLLYGKAGESIGRDAIDNGELLINNATASNAKLSKSLPLAGFAMNYAQELNNKISETNKTVSSVKDDLMNTSQNDPQPVQNSKSKTTENEDLDSGDANDIKSQGNQIKKEGNEFKREGDDAKKEKTKTDKDSKKEVNELKKTATQIAKLNAENKELNMSIETMNAEAETLNSELETASNEESEPTASPASFNNNAASGATVASASFNANSAAQNSGDTTAKVERLQAISTQSTYASNQITINNKSITVMNKTSSNRVKQLQKTSEKRNKYFQSRTAKAEETQEKNSKFQEKVNTTAKIFTGITATGLALMLIPWTHAVGQFMFHTGVYGTAACYTTNAAIYAANGNLKAALVNFGAAALSVVAAGGAATVAMGTVSQVAAQAGTSVAVTSAVIAGTQAGSAALQKAADKQFQTTDESATKTKTERRLLSYQEKRRRQSKMDKIDQTKKVLMARGQNRR